MRIDPIQPGQGLGRAIVQRPTVAQGAPRDTPTGPPHRPRHVLLGWRILHAPLVVQVLADYGRGPSLGAAEAMRRYTQVSVGPAPARVCRDA